MTEESLQIADVTKDVADEIGASPAQVALSSILHTGRITAPIIGARTSDQLSDNLASLEVTLDNTQLERLQEASAIDLGFPHEFLARPMTRAIMFGEKGEPPVRLSRMRG